MFHLDYVADSKSGKQTTLSFKPVQKKSPFSSDGESKSDMEFIPEEVAPREKIQRKGEGLFTCTFLSIMFMSINIR